MWKIFEHRKVDKVFKKIPPQIQEKYQLWKSIVRYNGPTKLREFPGFHDEKLSGKRKGQSSSRLSLKYRVIYEIESEEVAVYVIQITPHDY